MTSEHPNDPLDYLYEELAPERMAEARAHLSECPACREEMRKIRETVKTYRRADAPTPPAGLAARAAALALEAARANTPPQTGDSRPNEVAAAAEAEDPAQEAEFARLKQELLGEMRTGWRTWFFHPAWAVAAAVTFVCSVLIHVSPRGNLWFDEPRAAPIVAEQSAPARMQDPVPLPEPKKELRLKQAAPYEPAPPVLREAEAIRETSARHRESPPPRPAVSASSVPESEVSAASEEAVAAGDAATDFGAAETESMDLAAAPPGDLAPPSPSPSPAASAPSVAPAREEANAAYAAAPGPESDEAAEKDAMELAAAPTGELRPPPPAAPAVAPAAPEPSLATADAVPAASDLSGLVSLRKNEEATLGGAVSSRYFYRDGKLEAKKLQSEASQENEAVKEKTAEPVIVNEFDFREPPQLIARPTPIDVGKLARDLSTLAGMQIGSGEIADAWITIGMLRRYDPKKADELAAILEEMEKAAEARATAEEAEKAGQTDEPPAAAPQPDKYYTPIAEPTPPAPAVPDTELPAASAAEPIAVVEAEPLAEAVSASLSSVPESTPVVETAALDAPIVAPVAEPGTPQYYIGPVYSADEPPPLPQMRAASVPPTVTAPVAVAVPALSVEPDSPVADAPTVPKASEDAPPPTLWESGRFDRSRRISPPRDERSLPAWRRTFSTDPYYRDE